MIFVMWSVISGYCSVSTRVPVSTQRIWQQPKQKLPSPVQTRRRIQHRISIQERMLKDRTTHSPALPLWLAGCGSRLAPTQGFLSPHFVHSLSQFRAFVMFLFDAFLAQSRYVSKTCAAGPSEPLQDAAIQLGLKRGVEGWGAKAVWQNSPQSGCAWPPFSPKLLLLWVSNNNAA